MIGNITSAVLLVFLLIYFLHDPAQPKKYQKNIEAYFKKIKNQSNADKNTNHKSENFEFSPIYDPKKTYNPEKERIKLLLVAQWRGGSTLISDIFNLNPFVCYNFEPLVLRNTGVFNHDNPTDPMFTEDPTKPLNLSIHLNW